ncbi:hypothetical protein BDP27DRAFT_1427675 [Rhodocollybia butyracea]|uniref:Uncharacterized protein n=1 Tax=Rhodocollybia butyracea TaxID=206335 RepID=A0A9P5PGC4_9AGAR|nr:hypothetical protein BDP27DRAFT_1427675 [Rhodocollybia butyracea]
MAQDFIGLSSKEKAKLKSRSAYRRNRSAARLENMEAVGSPLKGYVRRRIEEAATIVVSARIFQRQNSWTGPSQSFSPKIIASPDVFRLSGLELVKWDGKHTRIVRTKEGYRLMGLYAAPEGSDWDILMQEYHSLMEWLYQNLALTTALLHHRRGRYATIGVGYAFGGGRKYPGAYVQSSHNSVLLKKALESPVVKQIARYVDHE